MVEVPYRITVKDWSDINYIVWATKRSKAVHQAWSSAKDAGYKVSWTRFRAVRVSFAEVP